MRLLSLDLIRYGRFGAVRLDLPRVPLTVIHGPNEAGKSTALHAIDDLLFGFGHNTDFDFRFPAAELRLGAEIEAADGTTLAFRRRKGRSRTLLDPDEQPLPDAALDRFLGGCTPDLFRQLFALDATRLREGGMALLKDGGALGESLLSAGAALRDASALRRRLEAEADALVSPRRSGKAAFWQAESRFQEARKTLAAAIRSPEALRSAEAAATAARATLAETRTALEALDAADRADRRLAAALPVLARLDALRAERAALGAPEAASAGLGARLDAALKAAEKAEESRQQLAAAEADLAARRAAVPAPGASLAHRAAITALQKRSGAVQAALADRETCLAAIDNTATRLDAVASALGLAAHALAALSPTAAALADARGLIAEGVRLSDTTATAEHRASSLASALPEPSAPGHPDPAPARAALERLRDAPRRAAAAATRHAAATTSAEVATAAANGLTPRARRALAALEPPAMVVIDAHEAAWATLDRRALAHEAAVAALARDRAALDTSLPAAAAEIPDRTTVLAARAARDSAWRALRRIGIEGAPGPRRDPDTYEDLVVKADHLADRREAGAAALEAAAQAAATRARLDDTAKRLAAEEADLDAQRAAAIAAWATLWPDLDGPPLPPAAMRDWLAARERAMALARQAATDAREAALALRESAEERRELDALAEALVVPPQPSLPALIDALDRAVTAAETAQTAARAQAEAARQAKAAEVEAEAARAALRAWQERWASTAAALGLVPPPGLAGAAAALDLWTEALALRIAQRDAQARLSAIDALSAEFARETHTLADLVGLSVDREATVTVLALNEALEADIAAQAHHAACDQEATALSRRAAALAVQAAQAADAIAAVSGPLGVDPGGASALCAALLARDRLDGEIARDLRHLADIDPIASEQALRDTAMGCDADALAARIAARAAEKAAAQAAHEAAIRAEAAAATALAQHDDTAAAAARQAQADAAAAMGEAASDWLHRRAALLLLAQATRRYREQTSDPLLSAAGDALACMTGMALTGLAVDLDDNDTERLVALRADGSRLRVEALSEGARDQLFLSLRIAAIARRCAVAEPIPFVADDLFASFDDGRTAAGLAELARLGAVTQVLVFTHHEAVVEAALTMGEAAAVCRLGAGAL